MTLLLAASTSEFIKTIKYGYNMMVLAGANGSGKSTLLDIPTLFRELLASNDINEVFFVQEWQGGIDLGTLFAAGVLS